jgi:hypothetical protein
MKKRSSRLIMGSALGLATVAIAIDHTRHRLPEPVAAPIAVKPEAPSMLPGVMPPAENGSVAATAAEKHPPSATAQEQAKPSTAQRTARKSTSTVAEPPAPRRENPKPDESKTVIAPAAPSVPDATPCSLNVSPCSL